MPWTETCNVNKVTNVQNYTCSSIYSMCKPAYVNELRAAIYSSGVVEYLKDYLILICFLLYPTSEAQSYSRVLSNRNKPAASRMRLNSMQKACTSMNKSCTLMILFRMRLCKNTHTRRTSRFCMYLSVMDSQEAMQLLM